MKDFANILEHAGYKMTKPRSAILQFLSNHHTSLSAQDMHKNIKGVDQASVYRTLNVFEELHMVHVELFGKEKKYCLADEPHHHIICKKCGYMEKIKCTHSFKNVKHFKHVYHQLTLTGVCNQCNS
ncbi:MAG: Fur family transcriptional regulator [Candidatus Magasanikbacteria bacterium]